MASQEHDSAVERLEAALVEQDRPGERFDTAVGTSWPAPHRHVDTQLLPARVLARA